MADNQSPPYNSSNSPTKESPSAPSKPTQSPPPSSPPPSSQPPSSSSSPPPSSPPPSSPPPSSSSSPPLSSPPPPPSSQSSPPSSSSPPPPSSPPPSSQSPPPPSSSSSSSSPPPSSQTPSRPNSSPPASQSNQFPPPTDSNSNSPPTNNNNTSNSSSNNNNNNGSNNNDNNGGRRWQPPPPSNQSSNTPTNNNESGGGAGALSPPSETTNTPAGSSPSDDGSMVSIPLVAAVAAGAGLLIIIMLLLVFAMRRKRNEQEGGRTPYYNHGNTATSTPQRTNWQTTEAHHMNGNPYYNNAAHYQYYNASDQLIDLPAPPSGPGRSGWPTPSHNGVTNSDMSNATSSGPHGTVLPPPPPPMMSLGFNQSSFTSDELASATGGFSQANLLGQGGFGYVHKGILPNEKEIAVKSLKSGSGQGEREFKAEVEIISRVHHRHLVSLVGYCIAGGQRMLVYEFLPNNNLEFHLHGKGRPIMDWTTRLKIALGSAKGLAYLHEDCHPRIIHRDIKTSNILLDFAFEAKVSDFGLAKLTTDNNTHVSTRVMGTFGYLAPEYASSGKLTEKSDVFSFGVVLLELITGRRPVDPTGAMEDSLVDWARPLCLRSLEDGNFNELADPYLEKNYPAEEMARMVACAAASIRHSSRRRPKMSHIVRALEGDVSLEDLNDGIKPGQASIFGGGTGSSGIGSTSSGSSHDFDNSSYTDNIKKLRKMAVDNASGGPYISSEYGATSEYGLNPSSSSSEFGGSRGHSPQVKSSFLR